MKRANNRGTLYRRKPGGVWYTKIMIAGKWVRHSTGVTDREAAEKVLNQYAVGSDLPEVARLAAVKALIEEKRAPSATIEEAWEVYIRHPKNANQTAAAQEVDGGRYRAFVRWLHGYDGGPRCRINCPPSFPQAEKIGDVTPEIATAFVTWAKAHSSPATVNKYVRVLRRVWEFNRARENPWADFAKIAENAHQKRAFGIEELQKIVGQASGELRTLFVIGAYTGARLGDCAKFTWDRVDADRGIIRLRPHKTQYSSGIWIEFPMHPALAAALGRPKKRGYILPTLATLPEWKLSDTVQGHLAACGFGESVKLETHRRRTAITGFHSLRSTFVSLMADFGAPLAMVQALVGHVSAEMTMRYYRQDLERSRIEIAKLPDFTRAP